MHKQANKNKKRRFKSGTFKPSKETYLTQIKLQGRPCYMFLNLL